MSGSEQIPSFLESLSQLHSLKSQLLTLKHLFSPNQPNYHQLKLITQLRQQVQQSQSQISQLQSKVKENQRNNLEKIGAVDRQRKQLQEVNLQLVQCNEKLVQQLQATNSRLEGLVAERDKEREHWREIQAKYARDIDNLKLMHSQELYILKKKEKKHAS